MTSKLTYQDPAKVQGLVKKMHAVSALGGKAWNQFHAQIDVPARLYLQKEAIALKEVRGFMGSAFATGKASMVQLDPRQGLGGGEGVVLSGFRLVSCLLVIQNLGVSPFYLEAALGAEVVQLVLEEKAA